MLNEATHDTTDLSRRREQLARLLRLDARFSEIVSYWAGFGLQGEQTARTTSVPVDTCESRFLALPAGTSVTRRDVHFVSTLGNPAFLAAAVTELICEPRLGIGLATRTAIRHGARPLDHTVTPLRRSVCYVSTPSTRQRPDDIAVQATTILLLAGTPVALVTESVYWRLLTHRAPNDPAATFSHSGRVRRSP